MYIMDMKNIYLVLSVHEIRRMLRVAVARQKLVKSNSNHCLIFEGLEVLEMNGGPQLSSSSMAQAVFQIEKNLKRVRKIRAQEQLSGQ